MSETDNSGAERVNFLATLRNLECRRLEYEAQRRLLIMAAVQSGATWREVGEALGCSPQAAWKKYCLPKSPKINPSER